MPTVTASETVEVSRELVIEACAHLMAADLVHVSLNHGVDSDAGDIFQQAGSKLRTKALGFIDDETWTRDPEEVEIYARADEIAADVLERLAARALEEHFPPFPRIESYRKSARLIREQGTVDVDWPGTAN